MKWKKDRGYWSHGLLLGWQHLSESIFNMRNPDQCLMKRPDVCCPGSVKTCGSGTTKGYNQFSCTSIDPLYKYNSFLKKLKKKNSVAITLKVTLRNEL